MLGGLAGAIRKLDGMRINQLGALVKALDPVVLEDIAIDPFQPIQFGMQLAFERASQLKSPGWISQP